MSTPIGKIPEDPHRTLDEDQELVQSIIQEIKSQETPAQEPVPDYLSRQESLPGSADQFQYYEDGPQNGHQSEARDDHHDAYHRSEHPVQHLEPRPTSNQSVLAKIWQEAKEPLLVLCLYIIFGLRIFDKTFMRYIPRMASEVGTLNFIGVLAKGIILTLLFFIIKKFIK